MKGIMFKPWKIAYIAEHPDIEIQTRRLGGLKEINLEPDRWVTAIPVPKERLLYTPYKGLWEFRDSNGNLRLAKPRYQQGETVYIKEAYCADCVEGDKRLGSVPCYKLGRENNPASDFCEHWHSPLMMPMRFARYFITITDVRAERLKDISIQDIIAEGFDGDYTKIGYYYVFGQLWNSINKDYLWESNPWVWVYTFRREK